MIKSDTKRYLVVSLIFFCAVLSVVQCAEDYYKILGVPKNADDAQIKKAFKKLSLKYHPDKNKDNEEFAKQQFVKVAQAYETLIDPEQRKVYDQYGEEGVKRKNAGGDPSGNFGGFQGGGFQGDFQDIFNSFFGGGGGFNFGGGGNQGGRQRFTFNMGGGGNQGGQRQRQQQQPQEEEPAENPWQQSDVIEIKMDNIAGFYRRVEVWLILFYKPKDLKGKFDAAIWKEIAEKLYGIVKVAVINCHEDSEEALCEDFTVYDTPKILVFPANSRVEPLTYTGTIQYGPIASFAIAQMESFVKLVTENNYDSFVHEDFDKPKVILFTTKKSTPPLLRALSKEFKGRLVLGEVRESSTSLVNRFKITTFPTLLVLSDSDSYTGIKYEGEFKKDQIAKFFREHSSSVNKRPARGAGGQLKELTPQLMRAGPCSPNDQNICLLAILDPRGGVENNRVRELLKSLALTYANDPLGFHFIWKQNIDYAGTFDSVNSFPSLFVLKTKRNRYTKYEGDFDSENVKTFIDSVLSGSATFKNMRSELTLINSYDDEL